MSDDRFAEMVVGYGLPYPLPTRWESPDEQVIRGYIIHAKEIIEAEGVSQWHVVELAMAIREHIDTRFRDCWDAMVAAYFAAPSGFARSQYSYWLMLAAGSSKKYVAKVLEVVLQEDPGEIWEFTPWLATRVDQQQWDRLAPLLADEALVEQNVNLIRRKRALIERKGVNPWIPGVEL